MGHASREQRYSPLIILVLVAALVATVGLWATDKARKTSGPEHGASGAKPRNSARYQWKMITTWPKNFPGLGYAAENFARDVEEMSGGRLTVHVYGAGEIVPAMEVFDAVSQGVVDAGHGAAYYWKGKIPASVFFTSVPFGMTAQEMNGWLHYGGGLELWQEVYAPYNLVPMAGGSTGVQMAGWFNREINSIADLKGLKMRIALEWVGPYNDRSLGFHEVARYYYFPGWHEPGAMLEFVFNKDSLEALPDDLQAIVRIAARAVNQDMLDEYTARNNDALKSLIDDHGVELRRLPDDVLAALWKGTRAALDKLVASDPVAARVYESYRKFYKGVRNYHHISEQAYINTRDRAMGDEDY